MRECIVVVDMQNDFVFGSLGSKEAQAALVSLKKRIADGRERGAEIVFTRDTHDENYMQTREGKYLPVPHCVKGTRGWEIAEGLYEQGEKVFDKITFGSVELAQYLAESAFEKVIFCGVCTDICVVSNALLFKAYAPEREICVAADSLAGSSVAAHEAALCVLRSCQVEIV